MQAISTNDPKKLGPRTTLKIHSFEAKKTVEQGDENFIAIVSVEAEKTMSFSHIICILSILI